MGDVCVMTQRVLVWMGFVLEMHAQGYTVLNGF